MDSSRSSQLTTARQGVLWNYFVDIEMKIDLESTSLAQSPTGLVYHKLIPWSD